MKAVYWLPVACLAGLIVGSWSAREELRAFTAHEKDEKAKSAEKKPEGFDAFARMVKIPETARRHHHRPGVRKDRPAQPKSAIALTNAPVAQVVAPAATNAVAGTSTVARTGNRWSQMSPEDLRARIAEAQELWGTRVDIARANWKSKLKLTGEAEKAFDAALQEMNEKLYDSVSALATLLAQQEKMTPELGLRLMGDSTTILAETYDKIGTCVAPEMRETVSEMQVFDFIDPGVAEPLIDVQGKLEGFHMGPPGGRGR